MLIEQKTFYETILSDLRSGFSVFRYAEPCLESIDSIGAKSVFSFEISHYSTWHNNDLFQVLSRLFSEGKLVEKSRSYSYNGSEVIKYGLTSKQ